MSNENYDSFYRGMAVALKNEGMSLRSVSEKIKEITDKEICHTTVKRWVD